MPTWANNANPALNLFDPATPQGAQFTRYYHDASSGDFTVLGDYLVAPGANPIFQVPSATGQMNASDAVAAVNAALGTSIATGHGYTSINDFDRWTIGDYSDPINGPGFPKATPSTENPRKFDHVMIIWRNSMGNNGTGFAVSGSPGTLLGYAANTYSMFGAYDAMPLNIARHEFGHLLYGGNNFHTGGGGWPENVYNGVWTNQYGQYWITQSSGWSNMSLYNGSLNSWNAWDRQRMGWKAAGQTFEISTRNTAMAEKNGDLDASVPSDAGTYVLRDFATSGDALRIKLPFTDPNNEYPEFLWVENHQGQAFNGNPFDKWQYEGQTCIQGMVPGLQMYVQIDKEVRQDSMSSGPIYAGPADHLRPLDANGHYEISFDLQSPLNNCVSWNNTFPASIQGLPNPLTGSADRHWVSDDYNFTGTLTHGDVRLNTTFRIGATPPIHIPRQSVLQRQQPPGLHPRRQQQGGRGHQPQQRHHDEFGGL